MLVDWMGNALANPYSEANKHPRPTVGARSRAAAAAAVHAVIGQGRSLSTVLGDLDALDDTRDLSLVRELSFGTLRLLPRLQAVTDQLLHKPLSPEAGNVRALLLVGCYQLAATRIPPHAAVASSVEAARLLGEGWAAGLINALLRRFQREREALLAQASARDPETRWLFPGWLLHRLQAAWPDHWPTLVPASNEPPPMTLRVNRLALRRADYAALLGRAGIAARPVAEAPMGLVLERPRPVAKLPGFAEGQVSVQDAGAQLAAPLLAAAPGQRVLDACAAPGGKTAHLQELADNRLDLVALDADAQRLERVAETLGRLGLRARRFQGDARTPRGPWAEERYDRILLDAPCSATGVIRRHPDIKWLRRDSDIAALAARQAEMLEALWPLLRPGGRLLYATCSLLPEENADRIAAFLADHPEAREMPIQADWGLALVHGRQTLPGPSGSDGFYYAQLEKCGS